MKGIILAGGKGRRLYPLTSVISKQLLPVYDRQMIFYPLNTLISAGIKDILIVVSPDHSGEYLNLLGSMFTNHGIKITFIVQEKPNGLPEAFILAENFIGKDNVTMILGDNIFEYDFTNDIKNFTNGGQVFAKKVTDPERFGIVEFDKNKNVISIEEKPTNPKSNFALVGIYIFDNKVVEFSKQLKPSARNELEITDIQKEYLKINELKVKEIDGGYFDAGTPDSLLEASKYVKENDFSNKTSEIVKSALLKR
jgi:glucose-1-phosphate thymidylyltransferase